MAPIPTFIAPYPAEGNSDSNKIGAFGVGEWLLSFQVTLKHGWILQDFTAFFP